MKKQLYKFLSALFVVALLATSASAASTSTCSSATAASLKSFDCSALLNQIFSIQPGSSCSFKLPENLSKELKAATTPSAGKDSSKVLSATKDCSKATNTANAKNCSKTANAVKSCSKTTTTGNNASKAPCTGNDCAKTSCPTKDCTKTSCTGNTCPNTPVVTPPATETPVVTPPATETPSGISAYEMEVINLVNKARADNGLNALTPSAKLSEIARTKSQDMRTNGYFAHQSPTYGSPFDMLHQFGVTYRTAGENIAYGYATPAAVVEGWMNSQGHRENILKSTYTEIGVGYVESGNYWTQLFTG